MVLPELVRLTPVFQAGCPVQYQGDAEPIARLEIDSTKPSSSSINSTGKSLVQNFQAVKSLETKQDPPNQSQVERRKVLYPRTPRSVEVSLVEGHSKKKTRSNTAAPSFLSLVAAFHSLHSPSCKANIMVAEYAQLQLYLEV